MNKILSTFYQICEPSPKSFPNEFERKIQFSRNQKYLLMQIIMLILLILYVTVAKHITNFNDNFFVGVFFLNITVFCLLGRTHPGFCRRFYVAMMTVAGPLVLYLDDKNGIFGCWGVSFLSPMLLLYFSDCRFMFVSQIGVQLSLMHFYYRDKLIEVINSRPTEEFVRELLSCQMLLIVFSTIIIYNFGFSLMNTFKQDIIEGESQRKELEVQKTFVLSFSHEIRNLINTLTGNIQLSLLEPLPSKVKGYLEDAEVGASLLLQLINNILDTGNLAVGELDINHSNQMVHNTLEKMWRMCAYLLKAKSLKGLFRILKTIPRNLKVDHERIMQILINLIVNAAKFTDKGSVNVELGWIPGVSVVTEECFHPTPFDDENEGIFEKNQAFSMLSGDLTMIGLDKKKWNSNRYNTSSNTGPGLLKISVTDTGYGIAPENLDKVFDRFSSQVFGEGAASNKLGTTIGLYVTKELCHRMGGDVRVFSKVDKGTSFIACIPAEQALPEKCLQTRSTTISLDNLVEDRMLRAMIVDDLHFNIVVLTSYLERMKLEVASTAINGQDAVTKYIDSVKAGQKIDIVTMDVEMPVMDGKEAARRIRAYERENRLDPCFMIMISGNVCESEISQCLKHDGYVLANHFLKKPAIFDDVCRVINEHFSFGSQTSISSIY